MTNESIDSIDAVGTCFEIHSLLKELQREIAHAKEQYESTVIDRENIEKLLEVYRKLEVKHKNYWLMLACELDELERVCGDVL